MFTKIKDSPGQMMLLENDENVYIRCRVCGRVLRHAASVAAGIGPACRRREVHNGRFPICDKATGLDTFRGAKSA